MDQEKIKAGVRLILEGIGEDLNREGLLETPDRIARMYEEIAGGMYEDAAEHLKKRFHVDSSDMVLEKDITFYSMCEHHMLPFYGKCHIGYIPNKSILGLSKFARITDHFARRLQVQERLTTQIADAVQEILQPLGVGVTIEASHLCMMMRGVQKQNSFTITNSLRGVFKSDVRTRNEFLRLIR